MTNCQKTFKPYTAEKYAPNREITGAYNEDLAVKCENGTFVGYLEDEVLAFKGIPFATQPVGKLRWQRPEPVAASEKVYEAFHSGKVSIQPPNMLDPDLAYEMGEDCLYLNIYKNVTDKTEKKAVMVWIHGGAYLSGGNSAPNYDGYNFLKYNQDIILVTINYRMGVMGFVDFSHIPGGEKYPYVNLGIYDQVEALKWIKKNIGAFGGDPERITIFGESAGAGSVCTLAVMPEAKGLFKRVIAQSGSVALCTDRKTATVPADMLAKAFEAKNMDELLAIPEAKLIEYWQTNSAAGYNFIVMDDKLCDGKDPLELWDEGVTKDLDIMQGFMADEWRFFVVAFPPKEFFDTLNKDIKDRVAAAGNAQYQQLVAQYDKYMQTVEDPAMPGLEFLNDYFFGYTCRRQATAHANHGGRGYVYIMDKKNDVPILKACHGTDIYYVFNTFDGKMVKDTPANRKVALEVQKLWVNFAKTGDPSTDTFTWTKYDMKKHATAILGDNTHMEKDPMGQRRELMEQMGKVNPEIGHAKNLVEMMNNALEHYPEFKKQNK